jgi:hypothetical protein
MGDTAPILSKEVNFGVLVAELRSRLLMKKTKLRSRPVPIANESTLLQMAPPISSIHLPIYLKV